MERNTHKYKLKSVTGDKEEACKENMINVSRSIGNSGNWIGCGFIDKTGIEKDHNQTPFPFYSLVYVIKGKGTYIDENKTVHQLKSGSLFQRRPGIKHTTRLDPNIVWKEYYIDFDKGFHDHLCDIGLVETHVPVYQLSHDPSILTEFENIMLLLDKSSEQRLSDVALKFIKVVRTLVNQANRSTSSTDETDMIEKSCLDFNLCLDQRIDLKKYCNTNGWGYESFRKAFKRTIGISPGKYMVRRRLDEACRLLRSTKKKISQVSIDLGYKSQYEFSNQFKRQFGVFPTQFRNGTSPKAPESDA